MNQPVTVECAVHFRRQARGRKELQPGPARAPEVEPGRLPRVARLLALAHKFEGLLRQGVVDSYAELARLGHVTTARISQVMSLLFLAPSIQEEILFWRRPGRGRDPVRLSDLLPIARVLDWKTQRMLWAGLLGRLGLTAPQAAAAFPEAGPSRQGVTS
jgi:hypothetical protein